VLPGALGAVALVTALFGFSVLPISWAGVALLLLGIALLVIDAHVTSHGALTVSGLIAFVIGSLMLFRNAPSPYHANSWLIASIAIVLGSAWLFAMTKAVQIRRSPVSVGPQTIVGEIGEFRGDGQVFVHGELWRANTPEGLSLKRGQKVRVDGIEPGLVLDVEPLEPTEEAAVS
jgi:membrane-bound serine protease (ClpP class)